MLIIFSVITNSRVSTLEVRAASISEIFASKEYFTAKYKIIHTAMYWDPL